MCDNGPGIDDLSTALAPFKHLNIVTGLGLGLTIAQKICELHGGELVVGKNTRLAYGASVLLKYPIEA